MLLAACEQFLSKTEEQIQQVALETLEGLSTLGLVDKLEEENPNF